MKNNFILNGTFKTIKGTDGDTIKLEGYASTKDVDRDGDIIMPSAWTFNGGLDNFKNNPIILFNHSYMEPIGRAIELSVDDIGLKMVAEIHSAAGKIFDIIKSGILTTFSVGFRIKDAEFREETMGFLITDAELYEVSVVSVPANSAATFSVSKSFESTEDYEEFKKQFSKESVDLADQLLAGKNPASNTSQVVSNDTSNMEKSMDPKELKKLAEEMAAQLAKSNAEFMLAQKAEEKAEKAADALKEAEEKARKEKSEEDAKNIISASMSGAEKLISDLREELESKNTETTELMAKYKTEIEEKAEEMIKINASKRLFDDRGSNKSWDKEFEKDISDAYILGIATNKGWENTKFGKDLVEKVNTWSGVEVSSADYEQAVSTNVERDLELELVLAPLFREVTMTAASMIFPILPDAGYAEFASAQVASGSAPKGNLDSRADTYGSVYNGVDLTEKTVSTKKLISQSYLANETEEDAIMPVLPLIRESMVRSHARAMEQMVLAGNSVDGIYGTSGASPSGLIRLADDAGAQSNQGSTGFAAGDTIVGSDLLTVRRKMGKYGVKPEDIIYIVSLDVYYDLLNDAEFTDTNIVGSAAHKVTGQVGTIYGSKVIISDEFATKAAAKFGVIGVYTRNFFIPRLRGFTIESDNEVAQQRRVLVMSQRIGFSDIISVNSTTAPSVWGMQYKLA